MGRLLYPVAHLGWIAGLYVAAVLLGSPGGAGIVLVALVCGVVETVLDGRADRPARR